MDARIKAITRIAGSENVFSDLASRTAYASPADYRESSPALPLACVRPMYTKNVGELLKFCSQEGISVAFRGGGTSPLYPARPLVKDSLLILSGGLNRILEIDQENMQAQVQPGVSCANLAREALSTGLFYPPQPWSAQIATIGGNIALNASGASWLKYGPTANYVDAVELWLTDGSKLVCRNCNQLPYAIQTGFSLAALACGSAGCLGFIGECRVRLIPAPKYRSWHFALFPDNGSLCAALPDLMRAGVAALELLDASYATSLLEGSANRPLLAVEAHADTADLAGKTETILRDKGGALADVPEYASRRGGLLPALKAAKGPFFLQPIGCPPSRLSALLDGVEQIAKENSITIHVLGHAGVALMYLAIFAQGNSYAEIARKLFILELMLNDCLESEADAQLTKVQWLEKDVVGKKFAAGLRKLCDPAGILAARPLPGSQ